MMDIGETAPDELSAANAPPPDDRRNSPRSGERGRTPRRCQLANKALSQLARRGTCRLTVLVFNGAELYYLRFTDAQRAMMPADGYQDFAAPAWVCDVERKELADNPDGNQDTYRRGKIWYARVTSGDRLRRVRMEFDTSFGIVKSYLADLHGRGVDLLLIKK